MLEDLMKRLAKMPKPKCKCGTVGKFEEVSKGYNQFDESGVPIIEDIIRCKNCDEYYLESEYDKLPRVSLNSG